MDDLWTVVRGEGPLIATAIHDGHELRPEVEARVALDEAVRLQEEDPHTRRWTTVAPTRVVPHRSRFEVDLNRPRERAVYRTPADAWGLHVWRDAPDDDLVERSREEYDAFYALMADLVEEGLGVHGCVVVLDVHSYNHRRGGPHGAPDDPRANPEVNVGTASLDRRAWGPLVDRFVAELRDAGSGLGLHGGPLDVRENVRFFGGHLARWLHATYGLSVCCLAIELKKTWMDEWTGAVDEDRTRRLVDAVAVTVPGLLASIG